VLDSAVAEAASTDMQHDGEGFAVPGMWIGKPVGSYDVALVERSSSL
jgi:hypothetical protein